MKGISVVKPSIIRLAYARVSTKNQSLERQLKKFRDLGIAERDIFSDKYTGGKMERPGFENFLGTASFLKERGYEIEMYFDDISRFARTSKEGQELYYNLIEEGYSLIFLKTPHINSVAVKERLMSVQNIDVNNLGELGEAIKNLVTAMIKFQVATEFDRVQKERDDIVRRTKEGLARPEVKKKLGKQVIYPINLKQVFTRYFNKEINKGGVASELIFKTSKGERHGMSRTQLRANWDKYLEKIGMGEKNEEFKNGSN